MTPSQFGKSLEVMSESLVQPFTPLSAQQIEKMVHELPLDREGKINYKEFLLAFEVRDKHQEA